MNHRVGKYPVNKIVRSQLQPSTHGNSDNEKDTLPLGRYVHENNNTYYNEKEKAPIIASEKISDTVRGKSSVMLLEPRP